MSDNQWPDDLPGFRETLLEYFDAFDRLSGHLLPLFSTAPGMVGKYDNQLQSNLTLHDQMGTPHKAFLEITDASHFMTWERGRHAQRQAALEWLDHGILESRKQACSAPTRQAISQPGIKDDWNTTNIKTA